MTGEKVLARLSTGTEEITDNRLAASFERLAQFVPAVIQTDVTDIDNFRAILPERLRQAQAAADKLLAETETNPAK